MPKRWSKLQSRLYNLMLTFEDDRWGLADILRVCDRRIGKRRFREMLGTTDNKRLQEIMVKRI